MRKLLVVDDSFSARQLVKSAMFGTDFEILEAGDGREGLETLRLHPDIAVVLCDVSMPNMTGLEMVAAARQEGIQTTIIMLTANGQQALVESARQYGVRCWITKPCKEDLLRAAVEKVASAATPTREANAASVP